MTSSLTLSLLIPSTSNQAHAQSNIIPDDTLGANGSVVIPDASVKGLPAALIEGGVQRGVNLFHSFDQFNVEEGLRVYLANPAGIENILSRVTGMNPSDIQGTLGVDGPANLFLLNPNGIIFGSNASLDVQGSFVGSTANAYAWGEDGYFSATEPESSRLLTINPGALFFNQVGSVPGNIINTGTLAVGKDLTLSGLNLDLQGRLSAGGNLTLLAMETLKGRDSIALPFVAAAGGKLLVMGNQTIDILALNHPESGLFSLGDMVLRSSNPIRGDAHYWSGGNFSIEEIDGTLGNLSSPHDPIIRSAGDVSFKNYEGASLHIFAGGSVTVDNVKITGSDPTNNIQETVTLSNGTTISIDGSTRPTLDIRAGTKYIGNPIGITGNPTPNQLEFSEAPTTANIKIGDIMIEPPNGQVFLTNQYESNSAVTGSIEVNTIDTSNEVGNAGDVIIDSGQDIMLIGTNTIDSGVDIILTGTNIDNESFILADTSGPGEGGQIKLLANQEILLSDRFLVTSGTSGSGNGGEITIEAESVTVRDGAAVGTRTLAEGDAGSVSIKTQSLLLKDGGVVGSRTLGKGDAGNVTINGSESVKVIGIGVSGENTFPSLITTQVDPDSTGDGGNLMINTQSLLLKDGGLVGTGTFGKGDPGSLTINAKESVKVIGIGVSGENTFPSLITTQVDPDSTGDGGNLMINTQSLLVEDGAHVNAITFAEGDGGSLTINAKESVQVIGVSADGNFPSAIFALANPDSTGDADSLKINTQSLLVEDGAQVDAITFAEGDGGILTINASELVQVIGKSADGKFRSGIFAEPFKDSTRKGGFLKINTQLLLVFDGGRIGTTIDASLIENSLTFLPVNQIDTTTLLSNSCILRSRKQPGSLIITGSGGKPTAPGSGKISPFATGTVRTIPSDGSSSRSTQADRPWQIGDPIVEPQQVYRLADGRLVLSRECVE
ncbi:MAG: filamentous hemagglutinin N-terminal domain-containing protein [Moorea sp. SIOASIH]|uniref:two-partner secretion domain-containing protein n=1 Tax=Moorena sp. SIOASIH TaxID=2607817 RepID=UPI0013B8925E|nr:filamentous hemagglutinin N-terminal domain-containing protein [Moorena sp. SIOASIH]NEO39070.1 filamentous hemagglutinin N-terminal domain-containing protein [Moorena sp. SIOASIH]